MFGALKYGTGELYGTWGKDNEELMKEGAQMILSNIGILNMETKQDEYVENDQFGRGYSGLSPVQKTTQRSHTRTQKVKTFLKTKSYGNENRRVSIFVKKVTAKAEAIIKAKFSKKESMHPKPTTNASQKDMPGESLSKMAICEECGIIPPKKLSGNIEAFPTDYECGENESCRMITIDCENGDQKLGHSAKEGHRDLSSRERIEGGFVLSQFSHLCRPYMIQAIASEANHETLSTTRDRMGMSSTDAEGNEARSEKVFTEQFSGAHGNQADFQGCSETNANEDRREGEGYPLTKHDEQQETMLTEEDEFSSSDGPQLTRIARLRRILMKKSCSLIRGSAKRFMRTRLESPSLGRSMADSTCSYQTAAPSFEYETESTCSLQDSTSTTSENGSWEIEEFFGEVETLSIHEENGMISSCESASIDGGNANLESRHWQNNYFDSSEFSTRPELGVLFHRIGLANCAENDDSAHEEYFDCVDYFIDSKQATSETLTVLPSEPDTTRDLSNLIAPLQTQPV